MGKNGEGLTGYKILRRGSGANDWQEAGQVSARSAEHAIRQYVERQSGRGVDDSFVAIPERAWKPLTPKIETVTRVKFGSPEPEKAKAAKS